MTLLPWMTSRRTRQGKLWQARDTFETAIAAGSVNGTSPTPGPGGPRVIVDTGSLLSIAGGYLSVAAGTAGVGDPGYWLGSQARVLGRMYRADIIPSATGVLARLGWDSNQTGNQTDTVVINAGGLIAVQVNGTGITLGGLTYSAGATIQVAVIMRSAGMWFLYKLGANWIMIYLSVLGTAAMFPAVGNGVNPSVAYKVKPVDVFTPFIIPILCYDTFTRANGGLGSTETAGPDGQAISAMAWTGATWTISTNKAINTPTVGADAVTNGGFGSDTAWDKGAGWAIAAGVAAATASSADLAQTTPPLTSGIWYQTAYTVGGFAAGTANVKIGTKVMPTHGANGTFTEIARATSTALAITATGGTFTIDNFSAKVLTLSELIASPTAFSTADVHCRAAVTLSAATAGLPAGLVLNLDSAATPANFILVYLDGVGNVVIEECVAGVYAVKQTTAVTYSAGAALYVIRSGTSLWAMYNNAIVGVVQTMTANTNKLFGMFNPSASNSLDAFEVWPTGTAGEFGAISNY